MGKYIITNNKDNESYKVKLENLDYVRHWIINHLDLSKKWNVKLLG